MLLEIVLLALLSVVLFLYMNDKSDYWEKRGIPYEKPTVFFFGSFVDITFGQMSLGKYIERLYRKFDAPYFGFFSFNRPYLMVKDPDLINKVLIKDFGSFSDRFFANDQKIDFVMGKSLLGIKNPYWKTLRTKLSPVFTSSKMRAALPLVKECGENLKAYIESVVDQKMEGREIAAKYTTDVIATYAYGIKANSFRPDSEFRVAGRKLSENSFIRSIQPLAYMFAHLLVKLFKFKFFEGEAVQFLKEAFEDTMRQRKAVKAKRNDLIDVLLELKERGMLNDDYVIDSDSLVAQSILFFFAGYEATSMTISFTLHELCIHPEIQAKLRDEINKVLAKHGDLTYEALRDMNYLHMVLSETLRKYPLIPFLQRECVEDYEVPGTDLVISKGTGIVISQHGLHWDPKYFPEPEKYDPERFSEKNEHSIPHGVYMPFGDGPRNCIGKRFGFISVKLGIIYIVKNFRIERNEDTQETLVFQRGDILQTEEGIRLTFKSL